jgi:hypothetical protein
MKAIKRNQMMNWLSKHQEFVSTTENFNGSTGGIHLCGESMEEYKGDIIYDYYSEDHDNRVFGVLNAWERELKKRGWYSQWYDCGTIMLYQN